MPLSPAESRGIARQIAEEARRLAGFVQTFTLRHRTADPVALAGNGNAKANA